VQERRRGVNPLPVDDNVAKARMFHLSQGVLVGLRRRPPEEVLSELIDVAQRFGLSPFALARALVAAAGGGTAAGADAAATVRQCWGDLLESIASEQY
jgi:hypothetical protein